MSQSQPPPLRIKILPAWHGRTIESVLRQDFFRRQIVALKKGNGIILTAFPSTRKPRSRVGIAHAVSPLTPGGSSPKILTWLSSTKMPI